MAAQGVVGGDATKQPVDVDLTEIAGLSAADNDLVQRKSGLWVNRSLAQVKADLSLSKSDVGLGSVDNTADAGKPVSTAQAAALAGKLSLGGGTMTGPIVFEDVNLYRAAANVLITDGKFAAGLDFEAIDPAHGFVLHDRSNGHVYRLKMTAGTLGVEQVS